VFTSPGTSTAVTYSYADGVRHYLYDGWRRVAENIAGSEIIYLVEEFDSGDNSLGDADVFVSGPITGFPGLTTTGNRVDLPGGNYLIVTARAASMQSEPEKIWLHFEGLDEAILYARDADMDGSVGPDSDGLNTGSDNDASLILLQDRQASVIAMGDSRHLGDLGHNGEEGPDTPGINDTTMYTDGVYTTPSRRFRVVQYRAYQAYGLAVIMDVVDSHGAADGWEDTPTSLRDNSVLSTRIGQGFGQSGSFNGSHVRSNGLHYMRLREYSSAVGSFTSNDPMQYVDGLNASAFCRNRPTVLVDPIGLSAEDIIRATLGDTIVDRHSRRDGREFDGFRVEGVRISRTEVGEWEQLGDSPWVLQSSAIYCDECNAFTGGDVGKSCICCNVVGQFRGELAYQRRDIWTVFEGRSYRSAGRDPAETGGWLAPEYLRVEIHRAAMYVVVHEKYQTVYRDAVKRVVYCEGDDGCPVERIDENTRGSLATLIHQQVRDLWTSPGFRLDPSTDESTEMSDPYPVGDPEFTDTSVYDVSNRITRVD